MVKEYNLKNAVYALIGMSAALALTVPAGRIEVAQASSQCISRTNPSIAPPSAFSPATASDAELRCYGFPPRPTNPEALTLWTYAMQHAKTYVGPAHFIATSVHHGVVRTVRGNWAGYDARQQDNSGTLEIFRGVTLCPIMHTMLAAKMHSRFAAKMHKRFAAKVHRLRTG
jgi:hypothetical protein